MALKLSCCKKSPNQETDLGNITFYCVRNHVKLGVSLRIVYCVLDTGYGLGGSLGDCRPALPKDRKYQMVKKLRATVGGQ